MKETGVSAPRRGAPHDLVPWYVNGSLQDEEQRAFEEHLASCEACRKEVKFLSLLRGEVEVRGPKVFALAEDRASAPRSIRRWRGLLASAAALFAGVALGWWIAPRSPEPTSELLPATRLEAQKRSTQTTIQVINDRASFLLVIPVDLPKGELLRLEIHRRDGAEILRRSGIEAPQGVLFVRCMAADFPPGSYQAMVIASGEELRFLFAVVAPRDTPSMENP